MPDELILDDAELEDFNAKDASYDVWILGYDRDMTATGFEFLHSSHSTPDAAVEAASTLGTFTIPRVVEVLPTTVRYFAVEIETVVELGDDETENVGIIYRKANIPNISPVAHLHLKSTDYEFTDAGTLRVTCPQLRHLNKGDYVTVQFLEDNNSSGLFTVLEITCGAGFLEFVG